MRVFYKVTATTANKTWDRSVASREAGEVLALEWATKYSAKCTVDRHEAGFLPSGGSFHTVTERRVESSTQEHAKRARRLAGELSRLGLDTKCTTALMADAAFMAKWMDECISDTRLAAAVAALNK